MQTSIQVSEEQFHLLAISDVGPRIRVLREVLYSQFGDAYTSKNVAIRIGISPPTLSAIERGETKDCPSKVLHSISKDFHVDIDVFFDDFYTLGYRKILLGTEIEADSDTYLPSGVNPLQETEFTCIVGVALQASNGDRRFMYERRTSVKLTIEQYTVLIADIENSVTTLEMLVSPDIFSSPSKMSALEKVMMQLNLRYNAPSLIGWIPKAVYDRQMIKLHEIGEKYTNHLLEGDILSQEETNSLINIKEDAASNISVDPSKRKKHVKMPKFTKEEK
ncbi:helix-turn-helix domain-containing protein [Brevibacillus migulae]|uniref:helix-turn-helix domain-containing protein n=1 Tax=Brevibacillus migulae TaxID=1644114 RepID=UPI00106EF4FA|nr:helix-turn-helix transcriptional regulator [Brevibacillus migulae]